MNSWRFGQAKMEVRLSDTIENLSQNEARSYLKKFYQDKYDDESYRPSNGVGTWGRILSKNYHRNQRRILDVGCGLGIAIREMAKVGFQAYGVDLANAHWNKNGLNNRCLVANAKDIPFKGDSFDFVLCSDVLEHIPKWDIRETLNEIKRVGSKYFLFIVSKTDEKLPINGNIYTHITIESDSWWEKAFEMAKYTILWFVSNQHHIECHCAKNGEIV